MKMNKAALATFLLASVTTGCSSYGGNYGGASGSVLTTATGMTLYTFDKDADNQSNCYDACAAKWPPYLANNAEAPSPSATKSTRKDGSAQWSVNSKPLYTWVGDTKPGDTTGDGVGGVWHSATTGAKAAVKASTGY